MLSNQAKQLWYSINEYFTMCDDPKYSKLHQFRNKILAITDKADRDELIKYFEAESNQSIEYFANPY